MPRSINPVPQFLDDSGNPLVNGLMYFYESGTSTLKTTFKDANLTIPNTNPVQLSANGEMPNVIYEGTAKQKLFTAAGVMRWERDPVGVIDSTFGNPWSAIIIYSLSEVVRGSDGIYYSSISSGNQGNDPTLTTGSWKLLYSILWSSAITYPIGANVTGSDGILYTSRVGGNIGNDPVSNPDEWAAPATITYSSVVTYGIGANVEGTDGILYQSLTAGNLGNDPATSTANWKLAATVDYQAGVTYSAGAQAVGSDGVIYTSRVGSNIGNDPVSSPTQWSPSASIEYAAGVTYAVDANVTVDNVMYYSKVGSNVGNAPASSPTQWGVVAFQWSISQTYGLNANVIGSNGLFYQSTASGNIGNDPLTTSSWVSVLGLTGVLVGTSTTTNTIATGSLTFITETGLLFANGMYIRVSDNADPVGNFVEGIVTNYTTGTGSISLTVSLIGGSGSVSDWTIIQSTAPPATGGARSFVASGVLDNGDTVILNADGTVSAVAGVNRSSITTAVTTGAEVALETISCAFDPVKNTILVSYLGTISQSYIIAGSVVGSVITWGTRTIIGPSGTRLDGVSVVYHTLSGNFVVAGMGATTLYMEAVSTSGNVPTKGVQVVVGTGGTNNGGLDMAEGTGTNQLVVGFKRVTNYAINAYPVTISGLTLSVGTVKQFSSLGTNYYAQIGVAYDPNEARYMISWGVAATGVVSAIIFTSNGSTINTFGGQTVIPGLLGETSDCTFDPVSGKFLVVGMDNIAAVNTFAAVVTITTGTNVFTVGPIIDTGLVHRNESFDTKNDVTTGVGGECYIAGGVGGQGTVSYSTFLITGTAVAKVYDVIINGDTAENSHSMCYISTASKPALLWIELPGDDLFMTVSEEGSTNATASNFLGISGGSYIDGADGSVFVFSSVADNLTGLTVNAEYYIQEDGTMDVAPSPVGSIFAGRAYSPTELSIKESSA